MEKGSTLIAWVLVVVALGILAVIALPDKTDERDTPDSKRAGEFMLEKPERLSAQLEKSQGVLNSLDGRLARLEENARGLVAAASGRHAGLTPEMQAAIDRIVQERLNRMENESTARAATSVKDLKEKDFEAMVADLKRHVRLYGNKYTLTRNALVEARNNMRKNLEKHGKKRGERKRADDQERRRLEVKLKAGLSKTQYQKYLNWKKIQSEKGSRKTKYLFGL